MKKALSFLLVLTMILSMLPLGLTAVSAEETQRPTVTKPEVPATAWTDEGNYDLSWCKTLEKTADNADQIANETVEVGGKYYHIKAWTKETYHITTPAQLAGLAYLSNITSGDLFKGDAFLIEADLDLGAHRWEPISKKSKFRGSLIGSVNGGVATISNMKVDCSADSSGVSVGLIGQFGGDWIKNLRLADAKIAAHSFTVGGFVGWQNGNVGSGTEGQGGYENLWTNAEIVVVDGRQDRFDCVGGIIGIINSCNTNNKPTIIKNCTFTGTIVAPYADNLGGILGLSQYDIQAAPVISDCVVITEKMEFGYENIGFSQDWNSGFGGIVGNIYANQKKDGQGNVIVTDVSTVTGCYFAGNMYIMECSTKGVQNQNIGGIVGASCSQPKTYENCQFDGMIIGTAKRKGGLLARTLDTMTAKNCVVTGIVLNGDGNGASLFAGSKNDKRVANDCYSAMEMLDALTGTPVTQITKTTDFTALLAIKDANNQAVWTKDANALYPILAIAKTYLNDTNKHLSVAMSGVDYSVVKFTTETTVADKTALDTVLTVMKTMTDDTKRELFTKNLNLTLEVTTALLAQYSEEDQRLIKIAMGLEPDAQDDQLSIAFAQIATEANSTPEKPQIDGTYNIRIVAKMTNTNLYGVKFLYTIESGEEKTEKVSSEVTECYRELTKIVDGVEQVIEAPDGSFYVVFVIKNVKIDLVAGTKISVKASADVNGTEESIKSSTVTFTLAEPAAPEESETPAAN